MWLHYVGKYTGVGIIIVVLCWGLQKCRCCLLILSVPLSKHIYTVGFKIGMRMLTKFSSEYYIGEVYVAPIDEPAEFGRIGQEEYDAIRREVYGPTLLEPPIVMKLENKYIQLKPDDSSATQTAELPQGLLDELEIFDVPSIEQVMFPTQEAIERFDKMGFFPK